MTAVDTNVVVRLLTADDPKQSVAAQSLIAEGSVWIAKTVLLEANWVLRSLYGFEESEICEAFKKLLGLKNVQAEDTQAVAAALELTAHGIEFADAIHFSSRPAGTVFVSFDKTFVRRARHAGAVDISGMRAE
jgi:predicted nucleic-acid-binding protein